MGFKDKIAIVTGGASGIGRCLAEELVRREARVYVADVDAAGAEEVARSLGEQARAVTLDVRRADDVERAVRDVVARDARLDLMFNNAGVGLLGEVRDLVLDDWRRVLDTNLWGVVHGTMSAYRVMLGQGSGHLVNVASLGGLVALPTTTPYLASKFAVVGLSLGLRAEAEGLGVKVSVACPGFVRTPILQTSPTVALDAERYLGLAAKKLKSIEPDRVARSILRGVDRNRAVITTDLPSRLLWGLFRLHPGLLTPLGRAMLRDFRSCRTAPT